MQYRQQQAHIMQAAYNSAQHQGRVGANPQQIADSIYNMAAHVSTASVVLLHLHTSVVAVAFLQVYFYAELCNSCRLTVTSNRPRLYPPPWPTPIAREPMAIHSVCGRGPVPPTHSILLQVTLSCMIPVCTYITLSSLSHTS